MRRGSNSSPHGSAVMRSKSSSRSSPQFGMRATSDRCVFVPRQKCLNLRFPHVPPALWTTPLWTARYALALAMKPTASPSPTVVDAVRRQPLAA